MSDSAAAAGAVLDPRAEPPRLEIIPAPARAEFGNASRLVFALTAVLLAAVRLSNLTAYGLFSDEVFSAETVHRPWPEMQRAIISDVVHPPLFYYLLKAWLVISDSLLWMKLLPVLFAALAIIPFVLLGRELKLRAATINLALFLMAVNEYLVGYAQELRMYSLLLLLVTTSMWLFAKLVNTDGRARLPQLALFLTNLLLVYTHYYGWLIVGGELLFLIIKRRDRLLGYGVSVVLLLAGFFPWAFAVTEAAYDKGGLGPNLKWNTRPTATDFFQHYVTLNGPVYTSWRAYATVCSTVIFFTPILLWLGRLRPKAKGKSDLGYSAAGAEGGAVLLWLALLAFLPALAAFAASYLLAQSVWGSRFLIVVAPAYLLLVAMAVTGLRPPTWRWVAVALVAAWAALSGVLQLTHRDKVAWQPLVERMMQQEANQNGDVRVYTRQGVVGVTVQYYLNQAGENHLRVAYVDDYTEIKDSHFWIAFIRYQHETGPLPSAPVAEHGGAMGEVIEAAAPGHRVILIPVWRRENGQKSSPVY